jgi:hypothetical protein
MGAETTAAVWGGISGGFFAVVAVIVQSWLVRRETKAAERKMLISVLQAILEEIQTVWDRYMQTMGGTIGNHPQGQPFMSTYAVGFDYFTIFHSNAFLIGRIDNVELRRLIVQTYTHAKGLIDSYRLNNSLLEKHAQTIALAQIGMQPSLVVQAQLQTLAQYADLLKSGHVRVSDLIDRIIPALQAEISRLGRS